MSKIKEIREKMARIAVNARAKFDEIKPDTTPERAAEIEREFDAMMADHDAHQRSLTRLEALEKAERLANAGDPRRPVGEDGEARAAAAGDAVPEYRSVFYKMLAAGGDIGELSPEERAVLRRGASKFEARIQSTATGAAGGFTVPTELATFIDRAMKLWGPMYDEGICTVLNTSRGNAFDIPTVDDTAKSAGLHTEGAALTEDGSEDVVFGKATLNAYVYDTEFIKFSMELAQDSEFNVEALLGDLLGERLARIANAKLTTGSGSSDVKGVVTASSLGKTAAAVAAVTGDEIIDLLHSVDAAYRQSPKARFMFHDLTLAAIRKLKDGQGNYLWQMGDVTKGQPGTLLGYRHSINNAMATGAKFMLFGDFGKFYVRKVGAPVIGVMRERFWPDLGIAGLIRFDGEIGQSGAIKHLINA